MLSVSRPIHLSIALVILACVVYTGREMIYSTSPPRHPDHDHAISSIDSGGFLRVDRFGGGKRNLVGRPGRVLIVHFFEPASGQVVEAAQAARFARQVADDDGIEIVFLARAGSWERTETWATTAGFPMDQVYLDKGGDTATRFGVRRWPETLIFSPDGLLAHQASGPAGWNTPGFAAQVERARRGVQETH